MKLRSKKIRSELGAAAVEYAFVLLVAVATGSVVYQLGQQVQAQYALAGSCLRMAAGGTASTTSDPETGLLIFCPQNHSDTSSSDDKDVQD